MGTAKFDPLINGCKQKCCTSTGFYNTSDVEKQSGYIPGVKKLRNRLITRVYQLNHVEIPNKKK